MASFKARASRPGSPAPFARTPDDPGGDRSECGRGRAAGRPCCPRYTADLPALQRRAFDTHSSTFSEAGQRTVTFDLWPLHAKRSSSPSHVSGMPREPATQHSRHACSTPQDRRGRPQIALFERPDGNRHRVARTRSQRCFTGRHTKPDLKNP